MGDIVAIRLVLAIERRDSASPACAALPQGVPRSSSRV